MSLVFSINFEANASELIENIEKMLPNSIVNESNEIVWGIFICY